jgi:hypothetical protein
MRGLLVLCICTLLFIDTAAQEPRRSRRSLLWGSLELRSSAYELDKSHNNSGFTIRAGEVDWGPGLGV